jgi:hypothetical protein
MSEQQYLKPVPYWLEPEASKGEHVQQQARQQHSLRPAVEQRAQVQQEYMPVRPYWLTAEQWQDLEKVQTQQEDKTQLGNVQPKVHRLRRADNGPVTPGRATRWERV